MVMFHRCKYNVLTQPFIFHKITWTKCHLQSFHKSPMHEMKIIVQTVVFWNPHRYWKNLHDSIERTVDEHNMRIFPSVFCRQPWEHLFSSNIQCLFMNLSMKMLKVNITTSRTTFYYSDYLRSLTFSTRPVAGRYIITFVLLILSSDHT